MNEEKTMTKKEAEDQVNFALMLTHLYAAVSELKCAQHSIPVKIVGESRDEFLKNTFNLVNDFACKLHDEFKEMYFREEEDEHGI